MQVSVLLASRSAAIRVSYFRNYATRRAIIKRLWPRMKNPGRSRGLRVAAKKLQRLNKNGGDRIRTCDLEVMSLIWLFS
jgi:hypothetical protein